jgi:hypothetical protein
MRQVQITRVTRRTRSERRDEALLPLDPRDLDVVTAKRLQRRATAQTSAASGARALPPEEAGA